MTSIARLRRRCEERVVGIELPRPFDIDAFCAQVAAHRKRPIRVCPLPATAGADSPCGAWLQTATTDWVFVEQSTSRFHRDHIVLHELAHMLCGHDGTGPLDEALVTALAPEAVGAIRHMLGRTSYTTREEQEAEMTARVILARAHAESSHDVRRGQRAPRIEDAEPGVQATIQRIEDVLG